MQNPFPTFKAFRVSLSLGVELPRPRESWRLLGEDECRYGSINAITQINGLAVATNGIIVALYNPFLHTVDFGHWEYFTPDFEDTDGEENEVENATASRCVSKRTKAILAEYV